MRTPGDRRPVDTALSDSQIETRHTDSGEVSAFVDLEIPTLTILSHPDVSRVGELVRLHELPAGRAAKLSRLEPEFAAPGSSDLRSLRVSHLSRQPILLTPGSIADGGVVIERSGSTTRVDIEGERLDERHAVSEIALRRGVVLILGHRVVLLLHSHHPRHSQVPSFGLIGDSSPMMRLRHEIQAVAGFEASVLLRGETGTGKELVAQALHAAGNRRSGPFISVNLAAIPTSLAASELFGAERGAYTGADRRKRGFFERAKGGTLFLDEIGETPAEVQPLLLRALESGEIQPVGSVEPRRVDARVIAATDADLESSIAAGEFRSPLLHRLAGYEIHLPRLHERTGDFGRLFFHFLHQELTELGREDLIGAAGDDGRPWPPADWIARLARYPWPGNVRQLRNVARRLAVARCSDDAVLRATTLDQFLEPGSRDDSRVESPEAPDSGSSGLDQPRQHRPRQDRPRSGYRRAADISEDELLAALAEHGYERQRTAAALGISRGALYHLIDQCPAIRKATDLEEDEIRRTVEGTGGDLIAAAASLGVSRQALKRRMRALGLR